MLPHTLSCLPFVERFYSYPVLASTNDTARSMTEFPETGIFVVQADCQTQGRGRTGAAFFSDNPGGLWVSIVTPVASIGCHFAHNRALSLAICETLEAISEKESVCSIKWPNDIFWRDRKICGILLENHVKSPSMLVLGFGCNVTIEPEAFPTELKDIATSLLIETGKRYSRSLVLKNVLERYHANCAKDPVILHQTYTGRLYGIRRAVEVDGHRGVFDGVEIDGRLKLKAGRKLSYIMTGHLRFLTHGENDFGRQQT